MKKYIRYVAIATLLLPPFLAIYSGSNAQEPGKVIPVVDAAGSEPQPISPPQTQDISDEISIKVKGKNASSLILVLVELTDRPLAQIYAEMVAVPRNSKNQEQLLARAATRTQSSMIKEKQQRLAAVLTGPAIGGREIYGHRRPVAAVLDSVASARFYWLHIPSPKAATGQRTPKS